MNNLNLEVELKTVAEYPENVRLGTPASSSIPSKGGIQKLFRCICYLGRRPRLSLELTLEAVILFRLSASQILAEHSSVPCCLVINSILVAFGIVSATLAL